MKRVSEILKEERERKGLSFDYIENLLKIKSEYLYAIEEGQFNKLPSQSYAIGFIKNYADFLGLPKNKVIALYKREYIDEKHEIMPEFRKNTGRFNKKSFFNAKIIFIISVFLIVFIFIIYQYSSLFFGPPLSLSSPKDGQVVNDNLVQIKGKTDSYSVIFVDKEEVYVNMDGSFKKTLYVFPGKKEIEIIAKNRFGKETREKVEVTVE